MPSFDVVSEINGHELTNAVDQVNREVANRFDFKGSNAKVEQADGELVVEAQSEFQVRQMLDILYQKMSKRGLDVRFVEEGQVEESGSRARMHLKLREGIDRDLAKRIVKRVKDSKLKVQASVQGEQVRISGKKRDDLQAVIAMLREAGFEQPLQFNNFRD